ncbi:helix-turn-helix domain-containing protein [Streptomyces canus]|uniref:helix-turn-helix domain-containing protein n=1 Tax=Streptomyces canus TaxID=58343 RepID=UPI0033B4ABD9
MSTTPVGARVDALLYLAGGRSTREAAEVAGVSVSTVAAWRRSPVFVEELAEVRALWEAEPLDAEALLVRLEAAGRRLGGRGR